MKKALATLVALVLTSCGGGGGDQEAPSTTASAVATSPSASTAVSASASAPAGSPVDLRSALVRLSDLPTGWARSVSGNNETPDISSPSSDCTKRWRDAQSPGRDQAKVSYERGRSAVLNQSIQSNPRFTVAEARQLVEDCPTYTVESEGSRSVITQSELSFPKVGEDSAAFSIKLEVGGFTFSGYLAVVRKQGVGVSTTFIDLGPDVAFFEQLVRTTVSRIPAAA